MADDTTGFFTDLFDSVQARDYTVIANKIYMFALHAFEMNQTLSLL